MAAGFGVPGGGKFQQFAGCGAREVAARVVAGADPVRHFFFENGAVLLAAQIGFAVADRQGEDLPGGIVAECAAGDGGRAAPGAMAPKDRAMPVRA